MTGIFDTFLIWCNWVRDNVVLNCSTAMTYDAYRYTYDSTFLGMANNFAGLAKAGFDVCNRFDSSNPAYVSAAISQTMNDINRTQRAVCGILNRYYYNAHLNI